MPYVRGHYRRSARRQKAGIEGIGILLVVGLLMVPVVAAVSAIIAVLVATVSFVQQYWLVLAVIAVIVGAIPDP